MIGMVLVTHGQLANGFRAALEHVVGPQMQFETIAIGPEAGFSPGEEAAMVDAGFTPLGLGARVLRTETAGIAVLAALAGRWEGW